MAGRGARGSVQLTSEPVHQLKSLVAYVRTQIQDPLLSVTLSVTLREAPSRSASDHEEGNGDEHVASEDNDDLAGMEEIDLLGGLANGELSDTRMSAAH